MPEIQLQISTNYHGFSAWYWCVIPYSLLFPEQVSYLFEVKSFEKKHLKKLTHVPQPTAILPKGINL